MSVTDMPEKEAAKTGPNRMLIIALAVVVLILAAGAYFVVFAGSAEAEGEKEQVAGEVMTLESIQINLSGGHYLRLGMALQLTEDAYEVDGSKALDAAIDQFSGLPMEDLTQAAGRRSEKRELMKHLDKLYHHEVMDVYFTEFVMQ